MLLKSLEIQGFKSFPDKTVLNFDGGITAIVGPNGSGKSNVSDAMRWVLGEQSTKTLRGGKMEDVIFKGTGSRGPVGFAQVSLIISNEDGSLPFDQSEVMVTRRYYRSGESEYFINKSAVRLKDIHELFMDTGLGRDGYSIIGQGRIDEILSVKSGDRREIFEEAAGISKYRHRKEEAERKLEHTEDNLLRIGDKISELELQVGPLKDQAEKAKRYLLLRDELRGLEVTAWMDQLDTLRENGGKLKSDFEAVCAQTEANQTALEALYEKSEELSEQIRQTDVALEAARGTLSGLEAEEAELESAAAVTETTISHNEETITRIQQESVDREKQVEDLARQIQELSHRDQELSEEQADLERRLEEMNEQARLRAQEADTASARLRALQEQREGKLAAQGTFQARLSAGASTDAALEERQEALARERERLEAEGQELAGQAEENRLSRAEAEETLVSAKNVIGGYELRAEARRKKEAALSEQVMKLTARHQTVLERTGMLREMEKEYEGYSGAVRLVMRQAEAGALKRIHGPVSSLLRTPDEYTVAIETALGPAMQNIVVETQEDAKEAIQLLKRQNAGRATFLPLDAIQGRSLNERGVESEPGVEGVASRLVQADSRYQKILENLLGRIVIIDQMDHGIQLARKYGHRFRIVTMDGQVLNAGGSMTGGSVSRSAGILTRHNELERLEQEAAALAGTLEKARQDLTQAQREAEKTAYQLEVARGQQRTAEDELLRLESDRRYLERQQEAVAQSLSALIAEQEENSRRLARGQQQRQELETASGQVSQEIETLTREIQTLREQETELDTRRDQFSGELSRQRERMSALEAERQSGRESLERLERLRSEMSGDRLERLRLAGEYEQKNNHLAAQLAGQRERLSARREESAAQREKIAALSAQRMELEGTRTRADKESQDRSRDQMVLERERARLEQQTQRTELEQKQLLDRLWEHYELSYSEAQKVRQPVEDAKAARARISELRGQISKLGSPNLGAIEEYDRVSERYDYLISQRDDVEKARADLLEIIGEITGHMQEIFSVEFRKINESFAATFTEIFGGGKAQLELENEQDILGCGIEIRVQLPGKRLETLSLLSGGERAFVAIALYFAILKVRPTPFCILDEIDAALDDVNVARYADYMRRLSQKTQFVVITHRRGTMEEADMLYGVTMKRQGLEEGVSKLLALRLSDVERELKMKL